MYFSHATLAPKKESTVFQLSILYKHDHNMNMEKRAPQAGKILVISGAQLMGFHTRDADDMTQLGNAMVPERRQYFF